jgi:hypothetical protein
MMNITKDVVNDLLPLYFSEETDKTVSAESLSGLPSSGAGKRR